MMGFVVILPILSSCVGGEEHGKDDIITIFPHYMRTTCFLMLIYKKGLYMSVCVFCGNNEYIEKTSCKRCGKWPYYSMGLYDDKFPIALNPFIMDKSHFEYKKTNTIIRILSTWYSIK